MRIIEAINRLFATNRLWGNQPPSLTCRGHRRRTMLTVEELEEKTVPASFLVTSLGDSGPGTLRQAILDSNSVPGPTINEINFDTASLGIPLGQEGAIPLNSELPAFINHVTIDGPTDVGITLVRADTSTNYRLVYNFYPAYTVTINNLAFEGGDTDLGGAIRNRGVMHLNNVAVTFSHASIAGGGIYNTGTMTLDQCNVANCTSDANGGGIASTAEPSSHVMTISNSLIKDNVAAGDGGGIWSSGGIGILSVTNSTIETNFANGTGGGGGIYFSFGQLLVQGGQIVLNVTPLGNGGGIFLAETSNSVVNTVIVANKSMLYGGLFGVGTHVNLTVNHSLIFGNVALDFNI
jgi:hypothetical protein